MSSGAPALSKDALMQIAADAATKGMADGLGGPFGAVVAREGRVIAAGANRVVRDRDPTAHAEIVAIRDACRVLDNHSLTGCEIYATCEPCPMCLAAIFWARIDCVYFASTRRTYSSMSVVAPSTRWASSAGVVATTTDDNAGLRARRVGR